MATMGFWMWLFGYSLLAYTQNYASSDWPVFLQASTATATTVLILLGVRLNSNSIRLESVVAVGIFNLLSQFLITDRLTIENIFQSGQQLYCPQYLLA